jgi:hypothetical protein
MKVLGMSTDLSFGNTYSNQVLQVYSLVLLDAIQSVMILADAFHWFVYGFGDMNRMNEAFLNAWDVPFLDALIAVIVQGFYCWRIFVLRHSYVLPIIIFLVCTSGPHMISTVDCFSRFP